MSSPHCSACGRVLPADVPEGLCPQCLLAAAMRPEPTASPANSSAQRAGTFTALSPEEVAAKLPRYEVFELLGRGGMGAVYKARQRDLDRLVAIKTLPLEISHDPAFAERFNREARALAKLNHANIVTVYDYGNADGLYYVAMEYVDGVNLRQAIHEQRLAPSEALSVVMQVCDALQYAHEEGVVHRDIKPENILLDRRGRVKIADFGLAKLMGAETSEATLTHTHQVMGTYRYMAPEQLEGSKAIDHRADIYSLGVVFYELLTGELPIGRFAAPSKRAAIDARLDDVVLRSLEKEPADRYQHASEIRADVATINNSVPLPPVPVMHPATSSPEPAKRSSGLMVTSILVLMLTMCVCVPVGLVGTFVSFVVPVQHVAQENFPREIINDGHGNDHGHEEVNVSQPVDSHGSDHVEVGPETSHENDPLVNEGRAIQERNHVAMRAQPTWLGIMGILIGGFLLVGFFFVGGIVFLIARSSRNASTRGIPPSEEPTISGKPIMHPSPAKSASSVRAIVLIAIALLIAPAILVVMAAVAIFAYRAHDASAAATVLQLSEETIFTASARGDLPKVIQLLREQHTDVDAKDAEGNTPLIYAAFNGHLQLVTRLIDEGAASDERNAKGQTAMMRAAGRGHYAVVNRLVNRAGENLNAKANDGTTALDWAVAYGHDSVVELLLLNKAEPTGAYKMKQAITLMKSGKFAEASALLEEAIALPVHEGGSWPFEAIGWQHFSERPHLYAKALLLDAAQKAGDEALVKQRAEKLLEGMGTQSEVTLYTAVKLSPVALSTNQFDSENFDRRVYTLGSDTIRSILANAKMPLTIRFTQELVQNRDGIGMARNDAGTMEGLVTPN